jgi:hypothetical protein|tara:strand:+ start:314 stop:715 length:402 start_codon:yes stop_codon:yes gene_type:complete
MTTTKIIKDSIESSNESTQEVPSQNSGLTEPPRNKGGRPKGSKNTLTLLQEAAKNGIMTDVLNRFQPIVNKTIELAEEGDSTCLKILWDRVLPAIKASDGTASQSNSGITIVVQGTKITQQETIEAELIEEET